MKQSEALSQLLDIADALEKRAVAAERAVTKLMARVEALEERAPIPGEPGPKGPAGRDGRDVDMMAVRALVEEAVAALPPPERGEPGERGERGPAGEKGDPGEQGLPGEVDMTAVRALVEEAVAALPPPERGEPGERGPQGEKGESGHAGADGRDGVGLAGALIARDGNLVVTLTDGSTCDLGVVVGKDGEPGRDGLGFEDLGVEQVDDRIIRFVLSRDGHQAEFDITLPVPVYRGVWKEGAYTKGDLATWAGSLWYCNEDTNDKPGTEAWTLAAKKGRDGKDAR